MEHVKYLSAREAAERLSVSERTIRRAAADGQLPTYRFGSRRVRFREDDVLALMTPDDTEGVDR